MEKQTQATMFAYTFERGANIEFLACDDLTVRKKNTKGHVLLQHQVIIRPSLRNTATDPTIPLSRIKIPL